MSFNFDNFDSHRGANFYRDLRTNHFDKVFRLIKNFIDAEDIDDLDSSEIINAVWREFIDFLEDELETDYLPELAEEAYELGYEAASENYEDTWYHPSTVEEEYTSNEIIDEDYTRNDYIEEQYVPREDHDQILEQLKDYNFVSRDAFIDAIRDDVLAEFNLEP